MNPLRIIEACLAGLVAAMLVSCAATPRDAAIVPAPARIWPPSPDEPRISFVQEIRGPRDIGQNPSAWHSMANWITGDTGTSLDLRKPFAVALDEKGTLILTDTDARMVCVADLAHKKWRRYEGIGK